MLAEAADRSGRGENRGLEGGRPARRRRRGTTPRLESSRRFPRFQLLQRPSVVSGHPPRTRNELTAATRLTRFAAAARLNALAELQPAGAPQRQTTPPMGASTASQPLKRQAARTSLLLVLLASGCFAGACAARSTPAGGSGKLLPPSRHSPRVLLQQTCVCPDPEAATSSCAAGDQAERDNLLRGVLQFCTRLGFAAATCCPNMPINDPKWQLWSNCLWYVLALRVLPGAGVRHARKLSMLQGVSACRQTSAFCLTTV